MTSLDKSSVRLEKESLPGGFLPEPDAGQIRQRKLILWTSIASNILGNSGLVGFNVALPAIQKEMGLTAAEVGFLALSTMLVMAMASAPVARLSDLFGRHRLTVIGLWVTIITSAAAALSFSYGSLFAARALNGLGLVTFFTTITTLVTAVYPPSERGKVLGLVISSVYIGLSIGPLLVGFLVQYLGWRSLFWFTVVGMIPPLFLIYLVKPDLPPTPDEKLDRQGALLWIIGLGLGFTGLARLRMPMAVPALIVGLVLVAIFIFRSAKSKNPVLDIRLFSDSRRFSFSSLAAFISYLSSTSITFLMSLYLQYSRGLSPAEAGMFLMAQPVVQALLTPLSGKLSDRVDAGKLASLGLGVIMVAIVIFANIISSDTNAILLIGAMALAGAGFALFSAPNSNAIMSSVPPVRLGQASGMITVTRLCGQISSLALTTVIFDVIIGPGEITPEKYPAFISASKICFWIFAPLCLTGILASLARGRKN
ncbi:MAG: MFS transporter [Deltaproteobacteria bacterium]|jgi:MFS family permease|nr:MFS transporter [Deltaproteobacteria bacterium]